jgi:hypothetical protein
MHYDNASTEDVKRAQAPHNLFISGALLIDLMMTPAMLVLKIGMAAMLIPLACSAALMAYIFWRSRQSTRWFVDAHWRLSFRRCMLLAAAYGVSALLILIAYLVSQANSDHNMQHILWTALTRVALMPTLIMVLATCVMEFSASAMALKGEVPDKLAAVFPAPVE